MALLGQEEFGSPQVAAALDELFDQHRGVGDSFGFTETETSRLLEQRVRLAQHRFATNVLANYAWQCAFCGLAPGTLRGYGLLIASHVKPWAKSNNRERTDIANGVCACPTHDSAFDAGLLTLTGDLTIMRAHALESRMQGNDSLQRMFGARSMRSTLLVPDEARRRHFIDYHRTEIFRG